MASWNCDSIIHYSARCHYYHLSQDFENVLLGVWVLSVRSTHKIIVSAETIDRKPLKSFREWLFFDCGKTPCQVFDCLVLWFRWHKSTKSLLFRNIFQKKGIYEQKQIESFFQPLSRVFKRSTLRLIEIVFRHTFAVLVFVE